MVKNCGRVPRQVWDVVKKSDILLEVVDSRMPKDTRISKVESFVKRSKKELILVLNKADLVPEDFVEVVKEEFFKEFPTVYVSCKTRKGLRALRSAIKTYSPEKDKVLVGVFGYPNTGKSSIINALVGRKRAGVAPIPGYTKGIQMVKLSSRHYLLDTPGIIVPEDKNILAILGAIRPEKLEAPEKAVAFLLEKLPKTFIRETYNIDFEDVYDLLSKLAKKFNYKSDDKLRRAAIKLLNDWISGKLKGYWF